MPTVTGGDEDGETTTAYTPEEIREFFNRKALAARRHRAAVTKQLGLTDAEADALAHLARSGGMTPTELSDLLGMTSGGITALTQRLERAGHITREPHPRDKRSSILRATPEVIERVQEQYRDLIRDTDRITARLSEQERAIVGDYLERLVLLSERHADEASAALEAAEEQQPHEPVELWA
jgi:DNA-binding MarR family transcriptional regulator